MASQISVVNTNVKIFPVSQIPDETSGGNAISMRWLGQAGFYLKFKDYTILIDPYLSDFLAQKYAGKEFPHKRMMPPPINVEQIRQLDFVFCTHGHSDHMDPGTLPILSANNPSCRFIVPKAEKGTAIERGVTENRMIAVNAGESLKLTDEISVDIIPSAHECKKVNVNGEHFYLGYIITINNLRIYHSGDCIPYPGLSDKLKQFNIDIALLPVNGRDNYRSKRGIPGNFTFEEAQDICRESNIPNLIVHHFGMFSFNTVNPNHLEEKVKKIGCNGLNIVIPDQNIVYNILK
ncbi:MAG: MBL fold metallo-hydrolase [Prolixibacteraceae bacterium]|jgi:L-ascorbate metabolism protein UlaG (beta-lactamase superfamily)|nr:MBL fold metallo-hydrolase [Prolixibacteraceae bacterium]